MRNLVVLTLGVLVMAFFLFFSSVFSRPTFKSDDFVSEPDPIIAVLPHQDDELFMAGFLTRSVIEGREVYAVMVTDGSKSSARYIINGTDGGETEIVCPLHGRVHHLQEEGYAELSREDFTAARNREFLDSVKMLGVPEDHVIFLNPGGVAGSPEPHYSDNGLDEERAELVFEDLRKKLGDGIYVTVSGGHPDHAALAKGLAKAEGISEKRWFPLKPDSKSISVVLNDKELELKREALSVYSIWNPTQGRFAVGRHSVSDLLDAWHDAGTEYYTAQSL